MKGIKLPDRHPLTWMTDLLIGKVCSKDQKAFLICGAWSLWAGEMDAHMARNSGGVKAAVWYVAGMVVELLCMKVESNSQRATSRTRWKAPE